MIPHIQEPLSPAAWRVKRACSIKYNALMAIRTYVSRTMPKHAQHRFRATLRLLHDLGERPSLRDMDIALMECENMFSLYLIHMGGSKDHLALRAAMLEIAWLSSFSMADIRPKVLHAQPVA